MFGELGAAWMWGIRLPKQKGLTAFRPLGRRSEMVGDESETAQG